MRKLDLILENVRDEYMINLLEEGETTELETLKTKKFLNENLNRIRKMLIEEGALEGVKQHLGDNWGKYLAGAGAAGAGALGMTDAGQEVLGNIGDTAVDAYHQVPAIMGAEPTAIGDNPSGFVDAMRHVGNNLSNDIQPGVEAISNFANRTGDSIADAFGRGGEDLPRPDMEITPEMQVNNEQIGMSADERAADNAQRTAGDLTPGQMQALKLGGAGLGGAALGAAGNRALKR